MNGRHRTSHGFRKTHGDTGHDPYHDVHKPPAPAHCRCGVAFDGARWVHATRSAIGEAIVCPACRRTQQRDPAGVLILEGVPDDERDAMLTVLSRAAAAERAAHPLERVMGVHVDEDSIEIATTGAHCLRRMLADVLRTWRHRLVSLPAAERAVRLGWLAAREAGGAEH